MENIIKQFFYPKSICVVGASTKEKSIGYEILNSILSYGYKGKVYPVNPKANEILGLKCYSSINEISKKIDLSIVVVPKSIVEDVMNEILNADVKAIVLITAGFREIGEEGKKFEEIILENIKKHNAYLVGPNCMGIINTNIDIKLNATFVAEKPESGKIAFLSQSGALGASVLNSLRETDIKFAHFISVGNKADLNENDFLQFWQNDENVSVITLYLEDFSNGEKFIELFKEGLIKKPVIILKAARTSSGIKAASSHTGAIATQDIIVEAVLKQFGAVRVNNINELFNTAKGLEHFPIPEGNKVAIVTNAGGPAILTVDRLETEGLVLSNLEEDTKQKLKEIVHPEGSIENPIDLLPNGTAENYKNVIEILLLDENVNSIISIFVEPIMVQPDEVVAEVNNIISELSEKRDLSGKSNKPIFQVIMPRPEFWNRYRLIKFTKSSQKKFPLFRNPEDPPKIISNMLFYSNQNNAIYKSQNAQYRITKANNDNIRKDSNSESTAEKYLAQEEIIKLTNYYNIPLVKSFLINPTEILKKEYQFNYPVVLKGINKNVVHKTELNAVEINLNSKEELFSAINKMKRNFNEMNLELENLIIQPYLKQKYELLIGGFRDNVFGPIIMFGSGGKYVEIFKDTSLKSAYVNDNDIDEMINETKIGKIIKGVRGEKSVNLILLKKIIRSSAQMILDNEAITEYDINPLIITEDNSIYAVDVKVKLN